jgi:hypothetical protein
MNSAGYYAKEVPIIISSLRELLKNIFETVFTVSFYKNPRVKIIKKVNMTNAV